MKPRGLSSPVQNPRAGCVHSEAVWDQPQTSEHRMVNVVEVIIDGRDISIVHIKLMSEAKTFWTQHYRVSVSIRWFRYRLIFLLSQLSFRLILTLMIPIVASLAIYSISSLPVCLPGHHLYYALASEENNCFDVSGNWLNVMSGGNRSAVKYCNSLHLLPPPLFSLLCVCVCVPVCVWNTGWSCSVSRDG